MVLFDFVVCFCFSVLVLLSVVCLFGLDFACCLGFSCLCFELIISMVVVFLLKFALLCWVDFLFVWCFRCECLLV